MGEYGVGVGGVGGATHDFGDCGRNLLVGGKIDVCLSSEGSGKEENGGRERRE